MLSGVKAGSAEFGSVGATFGAKTHTLSSAEMPSHTHIQDPHSHTPEQGRGFITNDAGTVGTVAGGATWAGWWKVSATNVVTPTNQNTGGSGAHNNIQPTRAALLVIKV